LYDALDQQVLLAARPPSRLQRRMAYGVMASLVAIFCAAVPFAHLQLPAVAAFVPVYTTVILINDLITAALIVTQFWVVRQTWLLVLAGGYFFTALIIVPNALTVPGVFAPAGLLGAGMQTAGWISACWHLGSPLVLIAAILVRGWNRTTASPGLAIILGIALITAIVWGLTWGIVTYGEFLPQLYASNVQIHDNIIPIVAPMMALNVIALVMLWRRGYSVLDLWLMVMCCVWLFEVTLGGILAGSRYSLGWYTARTFEMAATFIVLLLFLSEKTALYAGLGNHATADALSVALAALEQIGLAEKREAEAGHRGRPREEWRAVDVAASQVVA